MTPEVSLVEDKKEEVKDVAVAEEGRCLKSLSRGNVKVITEHSADSMNRLDLVDVLVVPGLCDNLLSVPKIVEKGHKVILSQEGAEIISREGKLICKGKFENNLFSINLTRAKNNKEPDICLKTDLSDIKLWHRRLGHISYDKLTNMVKTKVVRGITSLSGQPTACDSCFIGKMSRKRYCNRQKPLTVHWKNCLLTYVGHLKTLP